MPVNYPHRIAPLLYLIVTLFSPLVIGCGSEDPGNTTPPDDSGTTPDTTPAVTPETSPAVTPDSTPAVTPTELPDASPEDTPAVSPTVIPDHTPDPSFDTPTDSSPTPPVDADGDGYTAANDCNDTDASIHPGGSETCDGKDNDCSGVVDQPNPIGGSLYYADRDGDGYGNSLDKIQACTTPLGYVSSSTDCNDQNAQINPAATELCDGIDNDCDQVVDELPASQNTYYRDADGDGYGSPYVTTVACTAPAGYVQNNSDCNDSNSAINPGAEEAPYDGIDQNCDGKDLNDIDRDGYAGCTLSSTSGCDCDDQNANTHPGAVESINGIDDDCDGKIDEGTTAYDDDGDGYSENLGDCDDRDASVNPGASEGSTCDGKDQDCDGQTDEGLSCNDVDKDGYSAGVDCNDNDATINPGASEGSSCDGKDQDCDGKADDGLKCNDDDGDGYSENAGDCNDNDATIRPGASEGSSCDGKDQDCDGKADDGLKCNDDDGDGYSENAGDCNDNDATIRPGASEGSSCDGKDQDCDGKIDEGLKCNDDDGDGYSENAGDCNDSNSTINPSAADTTCDAIDQNCDGEDYYGYCSDDDADGYSELEGDCDDTNSAVSPAAMEVDNEIDDNCDGQIDEGYYSVGDIIVTELVANPVDPVLDTSGEWFELYNTTAYAIDLYQWAFRDNQNTLEAEFVVQEHVIIEAGDYVVFGNCPDIYSNGYIELDYAYYNCETTSSKYFSLANSPSDSKPERITVYDRSGGTIIDQISYAESQYEGGSRQLDPAYYDTVSNDAYESWCFQSITPGWDNLLCY